MTAGNHSYSISSLAWTHTRAVTRENLIRENRAAEQGGIMTATWPHGGGGGGGKGYIADGSRL
jgi:hypothetical protein